MAVVSSTMAGQQMRVGRVVLLFTVSGVAALVYQICWQRLLFIAFGVDIESITIIVSAFMLGLGVGALLGGQLADRFPGRIIAFFSIVELAIALFGMVSPLLIREVGRFAIESSPAGIAIANFLLLLLPTTLMGATLPMLVAHVVRHYGSVGVSIGLLYFVNTLGAAAGAAITGFVSFYYIGLHGTIYLAALLNFLVSVGAWVLFRSNRV